MSPPTLARLQRAVRRRPLASLASASSAAALGYATYREWEAGREESTALALPRDRYDPDAISRHWGRRPISVVRRLASIVLELGPVAGDYLLEFHARPWLLGGRPLSSEELEIELSGRLRASLASLGPTFVKAGQQLSIRPDLVSPTVLRELQRLCDAVPPFDDGIAMKVLAEELSSSSSRSRGGGDRKDARTVKEDATSIGEREDVDAAILDVFEKMPVLVASASLGQVYKARLRSNDDGISPGAESSREVAIKIQRPDILSTVSLDLYLLVSYGRMVDRLCSVLTNQVPYHETFLNGFANGAYMEMNYVHEAENQMYFRNELYSRFQGNSNSNSNSNNNATRSNKEGLSSTMGDKCMNGKYNIGGMISLLRGRLSRGRKGKVERVIVPEVHDKYTTERVLVTEWIDGTPLARAPPEQIRALIPVGVELFLVQLLDIGRFHADPHPGNLYVTTSRVDGVTPTLCLLDFGLIAHVSEAARSNMTRAIVNLLQGDYDALISRDAKDLGFLPLDMDVTEVKPVLKKILKEGLLESGSNLHDRKRNLMTISNELNEVFFRYPFSVPPFFALVTRGLGLLEGIAITGDPSFDIFQASYPHAKRRAIETFSVTDYGRISRNMLSLRRASTDK